MKGSEKNWRLVVPRRPNHPQRLISLNLPWPHTSPPSLMLSLRKDFLTVAAPEDGSVLGDGQSGAAARGAQERLRKQSVLQSGPKETRSRLSQAGGEWRGRAPAGTGLSRGSGRVHENIAAFMSLVRLKVTVGQGECRKGGL